MTRYDWDSESLYFSTNSPLVLKIGSQNQSMVPSSYVCVCVCMCVCVCVWVCVEGTFKGPMREDTEEWIGSLLLYSLIPLLSLSFFPFFLLFCVMLHANEACYM